MEHLISFGSVKTKSTTTYIKIGVLSAVAIHLWKQLLLLTMLSSHIKYHTNGYIYRYFISLTESAVGVV